jgi:hypothetical protein
MTTTVWPARRVGERILCGLQVDGRYVCQGEIAKIVILPFYDDQGLRDPEHASIRMPRGLMRDPATPNHWVPNLRSRRREDDGRTGDVSRRRLIKSTSKANVVAKTPWTRECPHCGCTAIVESAVLNSPEK